VCVPTGAIAQTRFDREALRFALRDVGAAEGANRQADESWRPVVELKAGTRVVVRLADGRRVDGRIESIDESGLTLVKDGAVTEKLARAAIAEIDAASGRRGSKLGAIIGGGAGSSRVSWRHFTWRRSNAAARARTRKR
jgi:hypothetical protein